MSDWGSAIGTAFVAVIAYGAGRFSLGQAKRWETTGQARSDQGHYFDREEHPKTFKRIVGWARFMAVVFFVFCAIASIATISWIVR